MKLPGRNVENTSPKCSPWDSSPRTFGSDGLLRQLDYNRFCPGVCYTVTITVGTSILGGIANLQVRTRSALLPLNLLRKTAGDASPCRTLRSLQVSLISPCSHVFE